jgi:uncharacterized integral membrane protein
MNILISFLKLAVTLVMAGLLLWVCLFNHQSVDITLPPFEKTLSLSVPVIIFLSLITGFIWGALMIWLNLINRPNDKDKFKKTL